MFLHLPGSGATVAPDLGRWDMALLYSHNDRPRRAAGTNNLSITRVMRRLRSALKIIHRQIAAAKIHRLRNELMLHADTHADWAKPHGYTDGAGTDAANYPQRPAVLGDKWDF
jgi:hypothetical protein